MSTDPYRTPEPVYPRLVCGDTSRRLIETKNGTFKIEHITKSVDGLGGVAYTWKNEYETCSDEYSMKYFDSAARQANSVIRWSAEQLIEALGLPTEGKK